MPHLVKHILKVASKVVVCRLYIFILLDSHISPGRCGAGPLRLSFVKEKGHLASHLRKHLQVLTEMATFTPIGVVL